MALDGFGSRHEDYEMGDPWAGDKQLEADLLKVPLSWLDADKLNEQLASTLGSSELGVAARKILMDVYAKELLAKDVFRKVMFHLRTDIVRGDIQDAGGLAETLDALLKQHAPDQRRAIQEIVQSVTGAYYDDPEEK